MRIVVVGAGVIGSTYGGRLARSGHDVTLLARGQRLAELRTHGLVLEDAASGQSSELSLPVVSELSPNDRYDLALVPVRSDQLASTLRAFADIGDCPDVLFFGNTLGHQAELVAALGARALFGFPGTGGAREGAMVRYVLVPQQKTMLGEPGGASTVRARRLQTMFTNAGFPTKISANIGRWVLAHTAFVVPIGLALYRSGTDPASLAGDTTTLRLMVRATREAFRALGRAEVPTNLRWLYLRMPTAFAVRYWHRVLASPRGELWFAAHARAAPDELHALAHELREAVRRAGRPAPYLDALIGAR